MSTPGRRAGKRLLLISVPMILAVTLLPIGMGQPPLHPCLICGKHGTADALLNVVLFVPVGMGLRLLAVSGPLPYLLAALLSALIEVIQMVLPGRHASFGDVVFNTLGGAVGVIAIGATSAWRTRLAGSSGRIGAALATALPVGIWLATGYLLQPTAPAGPYYAQWTPNLGPDQWYRGRVVEARLGQLPVDSARPLDADAARALWLGGAPLRVRAIAGPPPEFIAPLVRIHDARNREVVQLGFHAHDVVLLHRVRANGVRLDRPDLRITPPRALAQGDTILLTAWRTPRAFNLQMGTATPRQVGYTLGQGWALLLYIEEFPRGLMTALNACWIAGCVLWAGFAATSRTGFGISAALLLVMLVFVPLAMRMMPTPPLEFLAAIGGLAAGNTARRLWAKRAVIV